MERYNSTSNTFEHRSETESLAAENASAERNKRESRCEDGEMWSEPVWWMQACWWPSRYSLLSADDGDGCLLCWIGCRISTLFAGGDIGPSHWIVCQKHCLRRTQILENVACVWSNHEQIRKHQGIQTSRNNIAHVMLATITTNIA